MVDTASARTEKPALSVERISVSAPSPGQASFKEPNPPAAKPERTIVSPPAAGPQRAPKSKAADKEKPASIENPAPSIPKMEPQSIPLAALNLTLKSEPPEINDPAAKAKTEPLPAVPKTAAEPALSPMPVKSGDLVDLSAVDVIPALINSEKPVYPPLAYRNREEAKVKLSVLISEKGEVIDARLADDPSVNQGFAKAALRAVRRWVYSPALKSGTAVRVWKTVIIDFKIR